MRFLVISTPKYQVPLEQLPGLLATERQWYDRNREYLEAYGWFADSGGFGIADVPTSRHPRTRRTEARSRTPTTATTATSTPCPRSARSRPRAARRGR